MTTDDFYNVLKAFKTRDPNGNGKADEIRANSDVLLCIGIGGSYLGSKAAIEFLGTTFEDKRAPGVRHVAPAAGTVVCQHGWADCSDGQSYDITCLQQPDGTLACQCLVDQQITTTFIASQCTEDLAAANGTCGWALR